MGSAPGEPDKSFVYSNPGYVVLGAAAEAATGKTYEELVDAYVFQPAGMKARGFWPVTAIIANRATGYLTPVSDPLGLGPCRTSSSLDLPGTPPAGLTRASTTCFSFTAR